MTTQVLRDPANALLQSKMVGRLTGQSAQDDRLQFNPHHDGPLVTAHAAKLCLLCPSSGFPVDIFAWSFWPVPN